MKCDNSFVLTFPGKSVNEGFARSVAACFAAQLDPNLEELSDIKTAVSEAVTNAIVHAYKDTVGKISIKAQISGSRLHITVKDTGIGIPDIDKAMQPLFTTGGDDRSGMGFTIMESFMDKIRVRSKSGKGTTVDMWKNISPRMSGASI